MDSKVLYTAVVRATGGRGGHVRSQTGELDLALARPAQRASGQGTDPEELFAAGYAACFDSALAVAARQQHLALGPVTTTASVSLCTGPQQQYSLEVQLLVEAPDCPEQDLSAAVAVADTLCPYSNGIRGNVPVSLTVRGRPLPIA